MPDAEARQAWAALRAAARWCRDAEPAAVALGADGRALAGDSSRALCRFEPERGWCAAAAATPQQQVLFDLYFPVCAPRRGRVLTFGHLGQSLDGQIATASGDSHYVTGPENILHLHRMRALCDAVLVGADTVLNDDPRLTTRLADGDNAVRVVLDPTRRLDASFRLFQDDLAPTLLICDAQHAEAGAAPGRARVLGVAAEHGRLRLDRLLERLREQGIGTLFVEGGGATVSSFVQAGLLDRLHLAIAPLIVGGGRPGIRLPAPDALAECARPAHRVFRMGTDVLFDCDLRNRAADQTATGLTRVL